MNEEREINFVCAESFSQLAIIKKDVQALFMKVFGKPLTDEAWRHYYLKPPHGSATVFAGYSEEELVAHGGILPQHLVSSNGEKFAYYLQTAIMVHPSYRNLSVFNELMGNIHSYVSGREMFAMAFPNDNSYMPFIKMLKWRKIAEYNISQYVFSGRVPANENSTAWKKKSYRYSVELSDRFLEWRGELNDLKVYDEKDKFSVVYKDYEGALEILDVQGEGVDFGKFMRDLGYDRINIPECFLDFGTCSGLLFEKTVGIPQRMCVYPAQYPLLDYEGIKPSLLLSDVF